MRSLRVQIIVPHTRGREQGVISWIKRDSKLPRSDCDQGNRSAQRALILGIIVIRNYLLKFPTEIDGTRTKSG